MWSRRYVSNHQVLLKLHAVAYTIFQMRAKMAMDKCHIFDWWMKREAFIVFLLCPQSKVASTKFVSIQRLELTATACSVKVLILIRKN